MIALDIQYDRTKTLWLDLKIMLKTVPTLLAQVNQWGARKEPTKANLTPRCNRLPRINRNPNWKS